MAGWSPAARTTSSNARTPSFGLWPGSHPRWNWEADLPRAAPAPTSPRRTFLVWGGGGHGKVVGDLVRAIGNELGGYVDSDPLKLGAVVEPGGGRVAYLQDDFLALIDSARECPSGVDALALGVGDNRTREWCLDRLEGLEAPALVHPSATVSSTAWLGRGTVVLAGVVVNAGALVEEAVILNTGAVVEHDCELGRGVHVSPGAVLCGGVQVGRRSWIGAGATVIPGVVIGAHATVGAGATVLDDVPEGALVVGTPARPVRDEASIVRERGE